VRVVGHGPEQHGQVAAPGVGQAHPGGPAQGGPHGPLVQALGGVQQGARLAGQRGEVDALQLLEQGTVRSGAQVARHAVLDGPRRPVDRVELLVEHP
jgi:hypothetical protein